MGRPRLTPKQKADNAAKKKPVASAKPEKVKDEKEKHPHKDIEPVAPPVKSVVIAEPEPKGSQVIHQSFPEVITQELIEGAILNEGHPGFKEDYLLLHALIKKYQPRLFMEVGTHIGTGTNIICNAMPEGGEVMSLDLPYEQADLSKQQPLSEGKGYVVGSACPHPFVQLWGNSPEYDYSQHPSIQGWFIDGEHEYKHVKHESKAAVASGAKLIVWHDADVPEVWEAITEVVLKSEYQLYRVDETRIAYCIKN